MTRKDMIHAEKNPNNRKLINQLASSAMVTWPNQNPFFLEESLFLPLVTMLWGGIEYPLDPGHALYQLLEKLALSRPDLGLQLI